MASTNIPALVRADLDMRMDALFGRVLTGFPCPLTYGERLELGWCNISPENRDKIRAVAPLGVLAPHAQMRIYIGNNHFRMYGYDAPNAGANPVLLGMVNAPATPTISDRRYIMHRIGQAAATKLFKWFDDAVSLSHDINTAVETYHDIMKMAKTAGHLHRMVPELYRLVPGLNQNPSFRASAVPHEWSNYPRKPVVWLTDTIAKCSLLAESKARWSKRREHTWPVIGEN